MAAATSSPRGISDPFDLGAHTPINLARGARAALLRNSPAIVNRPIGVPSRLGRVSHTPSSPLKAATNAAATEGAQRAISLDLPDLTFPSQYQPVSIVDSANRLAQEKVAAYNAKLAVFSALCQSFEETAKQFTTGLERSYAQHFSDSFLNFWDQSLTDARTVPPAPTYSSIAASHIATRHSASYPDGAPTQQRQQQQTSRPQGQPSRTAPPEDDLRV